MKRRTLDILITSLVVLLAVSTGVMIYLSNLTSTAFDIDHYTKQYEKLDVQSRFNDSINLTSETQALLDYLRHETDTIETDFYNAKEKEHMVEVRDLFDKAKMILDAAVIISVLAIILFMFMIRNRELNMEDDESRAHFRKRLKQLLTWTAYGTLIIGAILAVVALTFDTSFITFHKIFFVTDTWMLNPAVDNMIRMLPSEFFLNTFVKVILMSVVFAAILFVAGQVAGKNWKKKQ